MVERASRAISLGLPKVPPLDEDDLAPPKKHKGESLFDFSLTGAFEPPKRCPH